MKYESQTWQPVKVAYILDQYSEYDDNVKYVKSVLEDLSYKVISMNSHLHDSIHTVELFAYVEFTKAISSDICILIYPYATTNFAIKIILERIKQNKLVYTIVDGKLITLYEYLKTLTFPTPEHLSHILKEYEKG